MGTIYAEKIIQIRRSVEEKEENPYEIEKTMERGYILVKYEKLELEERKILDGSGVMLLPKALQPMIEELVQVKYPDPDRPDWLVSDETGEVVLGMSMMEGELEEGDLEEISEMVQRQVKQMYPASQVETEPVIGEGEERVCWFSWDIPVVDEDCCHVLFFRGIKGGMIMGSFDCSRDGKKQWKEILRKLLATIKDCQGEVVE